MCVGLNDRLAIWVGHPGSRPLTYSGCARRIEVIAWLQRVLRQISTEDSVHDCLEEQFTSTGDGNTNFNRWCGWSAGPGYPEWLRSTAKANRRPRPRVPHARMARKPTARSRARRAPASRRWCSPARSAMGGRSTIRWSPRVSRPSKDSSSPTAASTAIGSRTTKPAWRSSRSSWPTSTAATTSCSANADKYVRGRQYDADRDKSPSDPWYGGAGYGGDGRPDLSNTSYLIDALVAGGSETRR